MKLIPVIALVHPTGGKLLRSATAELILAGGPHLASGKWSAKRNPSGKSEGSALQDNGEVNSSCPSFM